MASLFHKILSPVDFNENSLAALAYARLFAQQNKEDEGVVYLLHVVPPEDSLNDVYHPREELFRSEGSGQGDVEWPERVARERLRDVAQGWLGGVHYEILTRMNSDPATAILEVGAELGATVTVMATHGRTGVTHLLLGSVAEKVVRESPWPVLTIRGK